MAQPPTKVPAQPATAAQAGRRGFMSRLLAILAGAVAVLIPAGAGLAVFLDPLRRNGGGGKFIPVTTLNSLPADGEPMEFPMVDERIDAWNRSREPIGAIYLRRDGDNSGVECLTATCPHAGCFVSYDDETKTFKCPCHNSSFTVDGEIIQPSPSPRAMDTLECKLESGTILVRYQNFYSGRTDKVPKS